MELKVTHIMPVEIDIEEVFNELSWQEKQKFIEKHLNDANIFNIIEYVNKRTIEKERKNILGSNIYKKFSNLDIDEFCKSRCEEAYKTCEIRNQNRYCYDCMKHLHKKY